MMGAVAAECSARNCGGASLKERTKSLAAQGSAAACQQRGSVNTPASALEDAERRSDLRAKT